MNKNLINQIKSCLKNGARFASFVYRSADGSVKKHNVLLGASFKNAYEKDKGKILARSATLAEMTEPAMELLASIEESLQAWESGKENSNYNCAGLYEQLGKGLKVNVQTGEVHLMAWEVKKPIVISEATKPKKKSFSKKDAVVRALKLRRGKIRQFKLAGIQSVTMNGKTMELS